MITIGFVSRIMELFHRRMDTLKSEASAKSEVTSRDVVHGFARLLIRTSFGKKHLVRPLLRTEISQVVNRRAWYDATKLTAEVLSLYNVPLCVEGWDVALHEIDAEYAIVS